MTPHQVSKASTLMIKRKMHGYNTRLFLLPTDFRNSAKGTPDTKMFSPLLPSMRPPPLQPLFWFISHHYKKPLTSPFISHIFTPSDSSQLLLIPSLPAFHSSKNTHCALCDSQCSIFKLDSEYFLHHRAQRSCGSSQNTAFPTDLLIFFLPLSSYTRACIRLSVLCMPHLQF